MIERKFNKIVAFAGHRSELNCLGIEEKLCQTIEDLIQKDYTIFYDGNYGAFDIKCVDAVLKLEHKYPHIKLIRILTDYHHDKEKYDLPSCYDGSILPEIEEVHYKKSLNVTSGLLTTATLLSAILTKPTKVVPIALSNTPKNKPIIYI